MKFRTLLRGAVTILFSIAVNQESISVVASVETRPAETNYQAQFAEQTRSPKIETATAYDVNVLSEDLVSPWGMDQLPDGRLIITQKNGTLVIFSLEDLSLTGPIEGIAEVDSGGQGGLLDVAVAPDFEESRLIYVTFSENVEGGNLTALARGRLSDDETMIEDFEVIFRAEPAYNGELHYGSRLVFTPDGDLFMTTGERSDAGVREQAQSLESYLGKVIHLTAEGEPVESNPFVDDATALAGIYTFGHRNVQGIAIHPETGGLWISEMGPRGGDELNLLEAGNNYGWPIVSYGIEYNGSPINEGETSGEDFTEPVYYWDPVIAPSGMDFYDSSVIAEWENNLFIGGLAGSHIARLLIEDDIVIGEERLLVDEGQRFRDVLVGQDGAVYSITDAGLLYQIKIAD